MLQPPLIELRQYVIAPGGLARMMTLFETYFIDDQDRLGLPILGHFTVPDDPDRLVWLRGFADLDSRPDRLGAFYGGQVWGEFGPEAIALVKDYTNVQLLREVAPGAGIAVDPQARPPIATPPSRGALTATTWRLHAAPDAAALTALLAALPATGVLGRYVSEPAVNNFPLLPIRQGEHVFTWFAAGSALAHPPAELLAAPPERLVLHPAGRSALR